ncbi:hypothetical protein [Maribacter sp. 2210JD10-5]
MDSKTIKGKALPLGKYPHIKRVGDYNFVSGTILGQHELPWL